MRVLGIDTSNYTTSIALVDEDGFRQERRLLSVGKGERGLRQSSALFLHTVNLPEIIRALAPMEKLDAVAYSAIRETLPAPICHASLRDKRLRRRRLRC